MPLVYLLDVKDRGGRCATAHVDFRSNRPVSDQADRIVHTKLGALICDWWETGEHYGRLVMRGDSLWTYPMKFDLRHYLYRDMQAKGIGGMMNWMGFELNGPGWLQPSARFHCLEIGRSFHEWNNDIRPARIEDDVTLPDGTVKTVCMDLRPYMNNVLYGEEIKADKAQAA